MLHTKAPLSLHYLPYISYSRSYFSISEQRYPQVSLSPKQTIFLKPSPRFFTNKLTCSPLRNPLPSVSCALKIFGSYSANSVSVSQTFLSHSPRGWLSPPKRVPLSCFFLGGSGSLPCLIPPSQLSSSSTPIKQSYSVHYFSTVSNVQQIFYFYVKYFDFNSELSTCLVGDSQQQSVLISLIPRGGHVTLLQQGVGEALMVIEN